MAIDWWTLALQTINFLVLAWLLQHFLYRPVREVIEKRKALSEAAFARAADKDAEAVALKQSLEEERSAMARERQDLLKKMHEESAAEHEKLLAQSRDEARKLVERAEDSLAKERHSALAEIQGQAGQLAVDLAAKLLSQVDSTALSQVYLEKLEAQLDSLPPDELEQLKKDLDAATARVVVVTAAPLATGERDLWRKRLTGRLRREGKTSFETDPGILGGAELRFPHTTLKFTWADQLQKAKDLLQSDEAAS